MKKALMMLMAGFVMGLGARAEGAFDKQVLVSDDAFTASWAGTTNTGGSESLRIYNVGNSEYIFLKFHLPSYTGQVQNAVLELSLKADSTSSSRLIYLNSTSNLLSDGITPWTETNITWNNQPSLISLLDTNTNPSNQVSPTLGGWGGSAQDFSGTALDSNLNSAGSGGTVSFLVRMDYSANDSGEVIFYSKEYPYNLTKPTLYFNVVPEPATVGLFLVGLPGLLRRKA